MNRFTKDMTTIDDMLPLVLFDFIQVEPRAHVHRVTSHSPSTHSTFLFLPLTPAVVDRPRRHLHRVHHAAVHLYRRHPIGCHLCCPQEVLFTNWAAAETAGGRG